MRGKGMDVGKLEKDVRARAVRYAGRPVASVIRSCIVWSPYARDLLEKEDLDRIKDYAEDE